MKRFNPVLLALALSACSVGPQYQSPVTAPATVEATTFFGPMAASPKGREQIPNPVMTPESDLKICDG